MWMALVLLYGVLKGIREIIKKKSLESSSVMEVLFFYTLFSFLLVCPDIPRAGGVEPRLMAGIALKSFFVFLAWIFSFRAIKSMPISLYGVLDLSRVLFATLLAVLFLGERLEMLHILGLTLVCAGLFLLKVRFPYENASGVQSAFGNAVFSKVQAAPGVTQTFNNTENVSKILVIMAFASCLLNAMSGFMDKVLMRDLTSSQLQFWYMLFMVIYYGIYIAVTHTKIRWKQSALNPWIWLLALLFVIADRALFMANGYPESRISIMTLIKQSGTIVTILAGRFIFKEKNTTHKLICAVIIIIGIMVSVM